MARFFVISREDSTAIRMSTMAEAFFVRTEGGFLATEATRGPWDDRHQHAGPPSGLVGRALEEFQARDDARIVRVTIEILRPVAIAELRVEVDTPRPGRRVELLEARLSAAGQEVARARAWRMRMTSLDLAEPLYRRLPAPETGRFEPFFANVAEVGYHTHMDWRFVAGSFRELGPGKAWLRMKVPLVEGEAPSPLVRTLVAADSGNGVSCALDPDRYLFVNTDLNLFLFRAPEGEWIGMDSTTFLEPTGVGLTETVLHDERGPVGRSLQTLYVAKR
jgi:Acyl-CoA thioesterase C-terminal domain/Acyl-CoA thioesterase N-terminal domain